MLGAALDEIGARRSVVRQTVFLADEDDVEPCREVLRAFYSGDWPATSFVPQPPADGSRMAMEVWSVGRGESDVAIRRMEERLVCAAANGVAWLHADGFEPGPDAAGVAAVHSQTLATLRSLIVALGRAGSGLDAVVRTWLHLGDIVGPEGDTQRYKELNRARADVYRSVAFLSRLYPFNGNRRRPQFPASTGIGTTGRGIRMGALAMESARSDVRAVPLENPRQTPAFDYSAVYSPSSPKFSRGMALAVGREALILVSGTASITASETRHVGDAAAQTHETLENIAALIGEANLARHDLPGRGATLDDLTCARVYIKRESDRDAVLAACRERIDGVPVVFTLADVCRPDLLVEIEAVAASRAPVDDSCEVER